MAGGWREVAVLGRIWLVTDCCGLVCAFITWLLGLFKNSLFNDYLFIQWRMPNLHFWFCSFYQEISLYHYVSIL